MKGCREITAGRDVHGCRNRIIMRKSDFHLHRPKSSMRSHAEDTAKFWELRERGILLDTEVIETFVDRAEPASIISDFIELPVGLQKVIRDYFQHGIPERMRQFVYFGRSTTAEHDQRAGQRFANIDALLRFFSTRVAE